MIEFLSLWAKSLGVAIVAVSILEMLLPNNKTKKYIRMVMGIYIIFNIISPFVQNKDVFDVNNIDIDSYRTSQASSDVNQTSMNERIEKLYKEELEKDITKKINEKGYEVNKCKVDVQIADDEEETKITKIKLDIKKSEGNSTKEENTEENIENKIVTEIQKIKPIDTKIKNDENNEKEDDKTKKELSISDTQNIKKFLIEEYGVSEKCLEIN